MKTLALRLALFASLALTASACATDDDVRSRGDGLRPGYKPSLSEAEIVPTTEPPGDGGEILDPGDPTEPGPDGWAEEVVLDGEHLTIIQFENGRWELLDASGVVVDRDLGSSEN